MNVQFTVYLFLILLCKEVKSKDCIYNNKHVEAQYIDADCTNLSLTDVALDCSSFETLQLKMLESLLLKNVVFGGCSSVELSGGNCHGIVQNVTMNQNSNRQTRMEQDQSLDPPVLFYIQAKVLTLQDNISNQFPQQACIFISDQISFETSSISCSTLSIHQRLGDLILNNSRLSARNTNCHQTKQEYLGFVYIMPFEKDGITYNQPELSLDTTLKIMNLEDAEILPMHYLLISPLSLNQNYTLLILVEAGQLIQDAKTTIVGGNIGIFGKSIYLYGQILSLDGCLQDQGVGRGPSFYYTASNCAGSGGASAGQGGVGIVSSIDNQQWSYDKPEKNHDCMVLAESVRQESKLIPYNYDKSQGPGSGGGLQQGQEVNKLSDNKQIGSGGGLIKIQCESDLLIDGTLMADGNSGYQEVTKNLKVFTNYGGGGGGGAVQLIATNLIGNTGYISVKGGNSDLFGFAGEGGGGLIQIVLYPLEIPNLYASASQQGFHGDLIVRKGFRSLTEYNNEFHDPIPQYLGTDGVIIVAACPSGQEMIFFTCQKIQVCFQFYCDPMKFIRRFILSIWGLVAYISLFIFIVIGYVVRRLYRLKEAHVEQLPFDFETATKHMVINHLITQNLRESNEFQLIDLMYHAHRIVLQGCNSYHYPWQLSFTPSDDIQYLVDPDEWGKFANRINTLAEWKLWENIYTSFFAIVYYPIYWSVLRSLKKKKYKRIEEFINNTDLKLWKFINNDEQSQIQMKVSKSSDYTLLYLDIFNYKNSDLKYFFLSCPYIVILSGEGDYLRPYYLCESDPFLSCLYFAINKANDHDSDDERYKIMDNMVAHKKRMENSTKMNKFLTKFNRYARTIDFGSGSQAFVQSVKNVLKLTKVWNEMFFSKFTIRIDLVVFQTVADVMSNQQITVLENEQSPKFDAFLIDIHKKQQFKQMTDIKFGIFIYDTEMDVNEIDLALNNQKISFMEIPRTMSVQQIEVEQEEELNMNELKEQYLLRTSINNRVSPSTLISQQKYNQEIMYQRFIQRKRKQFFPHISYLFSWIRYHFISHRITTFPKKNLIIMQLILAFIDAMFLPLFVLSSWQEFYDSTNEFIDYQLLLIPFPFSMAIAPLIGCLWMSTQSYGIAKLHLIFVGMSFINLGLLLVVEVSGTLETISVITICIELIDFLVKFGLIFLGKRIVSVNVKLNKLNQAKHIAG